MGDIGGFFKRKELQSILTRVDQASANLQSLTTKPDSVMVRSKSIVLLKKLPATIAETKATVIAAKGFVTDLENKLNDMKLPETMTRTRNVIMEAQSVTENLRRTTETLEKFSERISERPPDLLFGKPSSPRWNEIQPGRQTVNKGVTGAQTDATIGLDNLGGSNDSVIRQVSGCGKPPIVTNHLSSGISLSGFWRQTYPG